MRGTGYRTRFQVGANPKSDPPDTAMVRDEWADSGGPMATCSPSIREVGCSVLDADVLAELDAAQAAPLETTPVPEASSTLARELRALLAAELRARPRWCRATGLAALSALRGRYRRDAEREAA